MLRQYGMEKLEALGEKEATNERHSQYFTNLMVQHEADLKRDHQSEAMRAIESDFGNFRLAWEWSAKTEHVANLHSMINGLYLFGCLGRHYPEIIAIFQNMLEQPIADAPLLGRLLARRWGYLHWWYQADYDEVLTNIVQALKIAIGENDQFEIAFCHLLLAYVMIIKGRYSEALSCVETSRMLFEAINEPYYICWVLHRLGYVHFFLNDIDKSIEYTEQSLSLARSTQNVSALVICLYNLGSDYMLKGDFIKGKHHGIEALQVATETGHQGEIAHALSLLSLCAFYEGDYATCMDYAKRSWAVIEDANSFVYQPYSFSLLILLACIREDYAEGVRLVELGKHPGTSKTDYELHYWARAALACGLGNTSEACDYVEKLLHLSNPEVHTTTTLWAIPCAAYALVETDQEKTVELLSWIYANPDSALDWVRQWPLFERLQRQLKEKMDKYAYQMHWNKGREFTFESINAYLRHKFLNSSEESGELADAPSLTAREIDILQLMAAGMTNPQIAAHLVIGAGTVKTHTLNIYRKLEVANRTQAIIRAQELGLLS
jgi:ATP/maltotriose-dependent transcriptional regulator MalT